MSRSAQGVVFGLLAAICYGFIPTFTLPVKMAAEPMADSCILLYRFGLAAAVIAGLMAATRRSFRVTRGELVTLTYLAFLSDGAALFLLEGYTYLPTGVATTLHFMYPVFTTLLMTVFYHEARKASTLLAVCMAVAGVGALSLHSGDGGTSWQGVVLELISAMCYALYIIRVNRSRVQDMDGLKLTFYIMAIGAVIFAADVVRLGEFQWVSTPGVALNLGTLALLCTVVTNLALVAAIKRIGSTMAAVLGALEPLTAVALGCLLWDEAFTLNVAAGILLIIPAVLIIIYTRGRKPKAGAA